MRGLAGVLVASDKAHTRAGPLGKMEVISPGNHHKFPFSSGNALIQLSQPCSPRTAFRALPFVHQIPAPGTASTSFSSPVVSPLLWVTFLSQCLTRPTFPSHLDSEPPGLEVNKVISNFSLLCVIMRTKDDGMFCRAGVPNL